MKNIIQVFLYTQLLFQSLTLFAADPDLKSIQPYLIKVSIQNFGDIHFCTTQTMTVARELQESNKMSLFGVGGPAILEVGPYCQGDIYFSSNTIIAESAIKYAFSKNDLFVKSIVSNFSNTYLGWTLSIETHPGVSSSCIRKSQDLSSFENFNLGLKTLNEEGQKISKMDPKNIILWIDQNFECPDFENVKSARLQIDVANKSYCPLDASTIETCFIARGILVYPIL